VRVTGLGGALFALAVGAGTVGLVLLLWLVAPPRPALRPEAGTLLEGDMQVQIQSSGWITHDEVGGPTPASIRNGFEMPASMMPGMPPHGTNRLYMEVVLSDVGQDGVSYSPQEFSVRAPNGIHWPLNQPASFGAGSLQPRQTRSVDLLFDVPDTVTTLDLAWDHDGLTQSIPVDSRPPPPHVHG
jgi:hypothetical protein